MGFGHVCRWDRLISSIDPNIHRSYGGDPLGLWGETDPEELLCWWLRIAANRGGDPMDLHAMLSNH